MTEIYFLKILILSVAQGIFEFIPVSSSGLLVVLEEVLKVESNNLLLNVTMHGGSLAAVVAFFFKDLISLWKNQKLLINLIIATIPVVITGGVLSYFGWINNIMNLAVVGYSTIFFGLLLFISDKKKRNTKFYQLYF